MEGDVESRKASNGGNPAKPVTKVYIDIGNGGVKSEGRRGDSEDSVLVMPRLARF